jgi:hypothetical protein
VYVKDKLLQKCIDIWFYIFKTTTVISVILEYTWSTSKFKILVFSSHGAIVGVYL